ncbi:hypothetical protein L1277_002433 [Okibacterium sp. HSC-33S16]|uniref:hypothetical protein n=1 Tax=Okibacterium sp. HSC-33S16 TaxID=2910965 RepID=UPI0020A11B12|nr:hypothetical protein [Okibacterium sp. HSC-33S16]MCP2032330.1 hypothetical protein [Okibacterium sp. HSC-33S16]
MDRTTKDILLELLTQAAAAHGIHEAEELGGVFDEEWPDWYADHMVKTLADAGYEISPSPTVGNSLH